MSSLYFYPMFVYHRSTLWRQHWPMAILRNETGHVARVVRSCVRNNIMTEKCGEIVQDGGYNITICCCDGEKCNDDTFSKLCLERTSPSNTQSYTNSASFISLTSFIGLMTVIMSLVAVWDISRSTSWLFLFRFHLHNTNW